MSHEQHDNDLSRRTFVKLAGAATGASLFGVGTAASASATGSVDSIYRNVRVREALNVWECGYRGRADRALALTDSRREAGRRARRRNGDDIQVQFDVAIGFEAARLPLFSAEDAADDGVDTVGDTVNEHL